MDSITCFRPQSSYHLHTWILRLGLFKGAIADPRSWYSWRQLMAHLTTKMAIPPASRELHLPMCLESICVCVYVCRCVYIYVSIYVYIVYMYMQVYIYIYKCIYVHTCIYVYTYVHMHTCEYLFIFMFLHML